jgi:hypothetical protein
LVHSLTKFSLDDGSWEKLLQEWKGECEFFEEDFDQFASASMPVLQECVNSAGADEGVFGLVIGEQTHAICRANSSHIPDYVGKVLRVRHILMSPYYDFGDASIEEYARVLSELFTAAIELSIDGLPSSHIKFHLRSLADRQFFSYVESQMNGLKMFEVVKVRGAWLYITKT